MDCMRINCAHDDPEAWLCMIRNLQKAREETGRNCRILMDVAGPKLRTGAIEPGPSVIKCRPKRDVCGGVLTPRASGLLRTSIQNWLPVRPWRAFHSSQVPQAAPARRHNPPARCPQGAAHTAYHSGCGQNYWAEAKQTIYFKSELQISAASSAEIGDG